MTDLVQALKDVTQAYADMRADARAKGMLYTAYNAKLDREAAAEIERLRQEREWRPIESAPKDGTFVLIAAPSGYTTTPLRVAVARYYPEYRPRDPWQTHSNDAFSDGGEDPTLWMPLPSAPDKAPQT